MPNSFEKNQGNAQQRQGRDEFFATRHSLAEYKLNEGIVNSDDPENRGPD